MRLTYHVTYITYYSLVLVRFFNIQLWNVKYIQGPHWQTFFLPFGFNNSWDIWELIYYILLAWVIALMRLTYHITYITYHRLEMAGFSEIHLWNVKYIKIYSGTSLAALFLAPRIIEVMRGWASVIARMRLTYHVTCITYYSLYLVWLFDIVTHNTKLRA